MEQLWWSVEGEVAAAGQITELVPRKKTTPSLTATQETVKETLVIAAHTQAATPSIFGLDSLTILSIFVWITKTR